MSFHGGLAGVLFAGWVVSRMVRVRSSHWRHGCGGRACWTVLRANRDFINDELWVARPPYRGASSSGSRSFAKAPVATVRGIPRRHRALRGDALVRDAVFSAAEGRDSRVAAHPVTRCSASLWSSFGSPTSRWAPGASSPAGSRRHVAEPAGVCGRGGAGRVGKQSTAARVRSCREGRAARALGRRRSVADGAGRFSSRGVPLKAPHALAGAKRFGRHTVAQ